MKSVSENYMVLQNGGDADGKISKASDKKTDATVLKKIRYFSVRKLIFFVLAIIWMVVIYMYSSRNAELSTADSHEVGMIIGQVTVSDFEDWTYEQQYSYADSIDHPVRKVAHFTEYAVLGILLLGAWYDRKRKLIFNPALPFVIAVIYAVSDEMHQLQVAGRAGMISDVFIDSSGALTGIILALIISAIFVRVARVIKDKKKD